MRTIITLLVVLGWFWSANAQNNPLSNQAFSEVLDQLDENFSDINRMRLAKEMVDRNYLSTNQLNQLLNQFDFEQQKEQLAKRAYTRLSDPRNFHQVYTNFDFDSTIDRLKAWANEQPKNSGVNNFNPSLQSGAMSEASFGHAYRRIKEVSFDNEQMSLAKEVVDNNYLSATQVRDLVLLLDFKSSQDDFAQYAYPKTVDQQNYSLVVEALDFTSSKQQLSNWLKEQPVTPPNNYGSANTTPNGTNGYNNNGTDYNNTTPNYNNNTFTPNNVSDADFINIQNQLQQISMDRDRLIRAKQLSDQSNWTSRQVRGLVELLVFEQMRLDFATYAYNHTIDPQNYYLVRDALLDEDKRQQLVAYVQSVGGRLDNGFSSNNNNAPNQPPVNTGGVTILSDSDFQASKKTIERYSSDSDRLNAAKSIVEEQYIVSYQVAQLVALFAFDDVRLDFAKYAYSKTQDKENYELVVELMQNTSSQEALRQYISTY